LAGFGTIKNDDVVVFHFPEGDTVALRMQNQSYYQLVRSYSRDRLWSDEINFGEIVARPVDKRENYIKRCVAISGDEFEVREGVVYVNGKAQKQYDGMQYNYLVATSSSINPKALERLGISSDDRQEYNSMQYILPLTARMAGELKAFNNVTGIEKLLDTPKRWDMNIFPSDSRYPWNVDNFGPLKVPAKGETVSLTVDNLPLYRRIIDIYEENELEVRDSLILINGEPAASYTFKMDYYWMMGDNRHNSADSRYWGFVPEDHVVGKASFIWLSLDKDKKFLSKVRLTRLFKRIR
jgi:signal peptidase I